MDATMIVLASGALLVRLGLSQYLCGLTRSKNAAGMIVRLLCDLCIAFLAFWAVGGAILFQKHNGFLGIAPGMLLNWRGDFGDVAFFHVTVFLIGTLVVAGASAERSRFFSGVWASVLLAGFIMPIAGHWAWNGWLSAMEHPFVDVGGASVIHVAAAICALAGAIAVGPRNGKYHKDGSTSSIPGHSLTLAGCGVFATLAGWVPYVVGSVALHGASRFSPHDVSRVQFAAAFNVVLAAAAGGLASLIYSQARFGKIDGYLAMSGFLGGLVAISAGAGTLGSVAAFATGAVAGILVPMMMIMIDMRWHVDDPGGGIAVHGVAGIWGTLAAALFADITLGVRGWLMQIVSQLAGLVAISVLAIITSAVLFIVLKSTVGLRATEADEYDGLDLAEHDVNAYPDFQQTMIKSYHLREA